MIISLSVLNRLENLLWNLKNRKGMYVSNESYEGVTSYINGFIYAIKDLRGVDIFNVFEKWLRKRKNKKGPLTWDAYIYYKVSNSDEELSQNNLFKLFSEFINEQKDIIDSEKIINENYIESVGFKKKSFIGILHDSSKWNKHKYDFLIDAIENFLLIETKEVKTKEYIKKIIELIISYINNHFNVDDLCEIKLVSDGILSIEQRKLIDLLERL